MRTKNPYVVSALAIAAFVTALTVGPAAQNPQPAVQFNTLSGAKDSTNISEPFAFQVTYPPNTTSLPPTVKVTLSNGKGQNQEIELTRYENSNSYVSQAITVSEGAQYTSGWKSYLPGGLSKSVDPVKVDNGAKMTVSVANGPSSSITVYQNSSQQALARLTDAMAKRSDYLAELVKTAQTAVASIDDKLAATTDPAVRSQLQQAKTELDGRISTAKNQADALATGRELMRPPGRDDLPMWRYTDQFKLAVAKEFLDLSRGDANKLNFEAAQANAFRNAQTAWNEVYTQFMIDYAKGWYEATTSLTLTGPAMTAFAGVTIYGKDATLGERLSAFKDLAIAVAMIKGLPKVVDIAGEKIAGELGGYRGNTAIGEIVLTGSGGASRAGTPAPEPPGRGAGRAGSEPGRGTAPGPRATPTPAGEPAKMPTKFVIEGINDQAAKATLEKAAETARLEGVPEAEIQKILDAAAKDYADLVGTEGSFSALEDGVMELLGRRFALKYPDVGVMSDPDLIEAIRSVRVKAALEASGKAQTWTPREIDLLNEINSQPAVQNAWEFDPPSVNTADWGDSGYSKLFTQDDLANIKKVATGGKLNVEAPAPIDPVWQAKFKDFMFKNNKPLGRGTTGGPGDTQILKPGEIKNTVGPRTGGELAPQFDFRGLRDMILARRLDRAARIKTGQQSPISGDRVGRRMGAPGTVVETDIVRPENLKTLTNAEVRRITSEDIRRMPTETRDGLPLEKLNTRQLQALAEADGVPFDAPPPVRTETGGPGGPSTGSSPSKDEEQKRLIETGRNLVEPGRATTTPKVSSLPFNATPTGTAMVNRDGTVVYQPVGGPFYSGVFGDRGALTITLPGTNGTFTFAPTPTTGVSTWLDATVLTFPGAAPVAGPLEPVATGGFTVSPLFPPNDFIPGGSSGGSTIGGNPDWSRTLPNKLVGLEEEPEPDPNPPNPFPFDEINLVDDPIGPYVTGPAEPKIQLFFGLVDSPVIAPDPQRARQASRPSALWRTLAELLQPRPALRGMQARNAVVKPPAVRDGVKGVFISLGVATGEAFEMRILNETPRPIKVQGDGVVLEPLPSSAQDRIRKEIADDLKARGPSAPPPAALRLSAYCLEFLKQPPSAGSVFRLASAELQAKYAPMRKVMAAAQRLEQVGLLKPDSDPREYYHSIRQWSLWTKERGFSAESFGKAFVDHAKRNFAAAKKNWTKQIESQITSLIPHRWQEITAVLQEAERLAGR